MILDDLPALQVVIPLLAAPVAVIIGRDRPAWLWTLLISAVSLAMSVTLLGSALAQGPIDYAMGGWEPPLGIAYRVDALSGFVLVIVSMMSLAVMAWAPRSLEQEIAPGRHHLFHAAWLLCLAGLLGMTITADAFNVFVFLEISSLASYILIGLGSTRRALTAAYRYLIAGSLGGTFLLIGIGLMYMMTGTLNMADLAARLPEVAHTRTVLVSFAFVTVGLSLKLALWPLHFWLPNAYTYAPSAVSAFVSATATKVQVYVLMRFAFDVYGSAFAFDMLGLGVPLAILALVGIYVASTVAIFQQDVKRLLAYSSVAQIGYMILGLSLASPWGLAAGILHLFNHALMKGGMFLAVGNISRQAGTVHIGDLRGIGRVMPVTTAAFVVGGAGLVGVPLTVGFISKFVLLDAILEQGLWVVFALTLGSSLLALMYVGKVVEVAWFHPPSERLAGVREAPLGMLIPTWIVIGATLVFGVWGSWTTDVAHAAALALLEGP